MRHRLLSPDPPWWAGWLPAFLVPRLRRGRLGGQVPVADGGPVAVDQSDSRPVSRASGQAAGRCRVRAHLDAAVCRFRVLVGDLLRGFWCGAVVVALRTPRTVLPSTAITRRGPPGPATTRVRVRVHRNAPTAASRTPASGRVNTRRNVEASGATPATARAGSPAARSDHRPIGRSRRRNGRRRPPRTPQHQHHRQPMTDTPPTPRIRNPASTSTGPATRSGASGRAGGPSSGKNDIDGCGLRLDGRRRNRHRSRTATSIPSATRPRHHRPQLTA